MTAYTLADLPPPPSGKTGWPWTKAPEPLSPAMPGGLPWPRISIVTPTKNQGRFIEETLRSVLLQGYPDLEYIVIDGQSDDETVDILRRYAPWLTYWVSEPDRNLAQAINKGFARATGPVLGWLNSDDVFQPGALAALALLRSEHPEAVAWTGRTVKETLSGESMGVFHPRLGSERDFGNFGRGACVYQPSTVFDAEAFRRAGGLIDESLSIAVDVELWMRLAAEGAFAATDEVLSRIRMYPEALHLRDKAKAIVELIAVNHRRGFPDIARDWLVRYAQTADKVY